MKLWYAAASPFARKVLILAHETGVIETIEKVDAATAPTKPHEPLQAVNPLGKIPALELEDGRTLVDSRVICEHLDTLHDGDRMFPQGGMERMDALTTQAMGDGLCDAAVGIRYEQFLRPEDKQWDAWAEGQFRKIGQTLDALEGWRGARLQDIHIGSIAVVAALAYLDFRQPEYDWREGRPLLSQMHATFSKRASMQQTKPE